MWRLLGKSAHLWPEWFYKLISKIHSKIIRFNHSFLGEKIIIESEFNIDKSPRINVISKFLNKKNEILTIAEVNLVLINKLNFSIIRKRPDFLSEAFSKLNG